jgi:hypothetical protein
MSTAGVDPAVALIPCEGCLGFDSPQRHAALQLKIFLFLSFFLFWLFSVQY